MEIPSIFVSSKLSCLLHLGLLMWNLVPHATIQSPTSPHPQLQMETNLWIYHSHNIRNETLFLPDTLLPLGCRQQRTSDKKVTSISARIANKYINSNIVPQLPRRMQNLATGLGIWPPWITVFSSKFSLPSSRITEMLCVNRNRNSWIPNLTWI